MQVGRLPLMHAQDRQPVSPAAISPSSGSGLLSHESLVLPCVLFLLPFLFFEWRGLVVATALVVLPGW